MAAIQAKSGARPAGWNILPKVVMTVGVIVLVLAAVGHLGLRLNLENYYKAWQAKGAPELDSRKCAAEPSKGGNPWTWVQCGGVWHIVFDARIVPLHHRGDLDCVVRRERVKICAMP